MPITNTTLAHGVKEEGRKFSDRFRVVSWAYPDLKQQAPPSSITHPKPPHYHDSLFNDPSACRYAGSFGRLDEKCRSETSGVDAAIVQDAEELNVELLVGVKCAEDTLKLYEIGVGFYYAEPDSSSQLEERSLCRAITDDDITVGKERWADLVRNLTSEYSSFSPPRHDNGRQDNGRQDLRSPTSSEFDLTDSEHSEHSVDSDPVPSTPKPRSYANVAVKQASPTPPDFSPSRSLNAFASSFIPTLTTPVEVPTAYTLSSQFSRAIPSPSPIESNPTFSSLNLGIHFSPSLPPTLKKDDQGFYTEVPRSPTEQRSISDRALRSPTSLLPSFLADPSHPPRRKSKTRQIVDQLRSASVNDFDRPRSRGCVPIRPVSTPYQLTLAGPSMLTARDESDAPQPPNSSGSVVEDFEEEGDGWLRAEVEDSDPEAKARRTRNLVQALGRNRSDSTQGSDSDTNQKESGWEIFSQPAQESKRSSKEASLVRRKGSRHRSRKSHGGFHGSAFASPTPPPPMPLPLPSLSPTQPLFAYPVYTTPYPYAASYNSLQMPTRTHCFPPHTAYGGTPFTSMGLYHSQFPPSASPMNLQSGFDKNGITGGTGIRHTQW